MTNVVLGHHPGYLALANRLDSVVTFNVPASIWNGMSPAHRWRLNRGFLQDAIDRNDKFVFSHHPLSARRASSYFKEIRFLRSQGVRVLPSQVAFVP